MSAIKETVLKLPYEEKVELLYALQEDLQWDENVLHEDELSPEDWAELKKREMLHANGKMEWIETEEFDNFLKERRNAIQGNQGRVG